MTVRKHGFRRRTRGKFSKHFRSRGKLSIRNFFASFSEGDAVVLKAEPAIHNGMYHPRFHGRTGKVLGMQGKCYRVLLNDRTKLKMFIVHPVHLKRLSQ